jgi:predicted metalloprotease
MRWDRDHESPDLIDERAEGGRMAGSSMLGLLPLLLRFRYGWVVILLVLGLGAARGLLGGGNAPHVADTSTVAVPGGDERKHLIAFVLDDTQQTWRKIFADNGQTYRNAKLVLFSGSTETSCGSGDAATGPFYCPNDERVYIDTSFYDELAQRFGAKGDFAESYVIAHEIGHHVQKLLGISERMNNASKSALTGATGLSVRLELQADCFAGIWARSTDQRQILDAGDADEAMQAASSIGDDRIQRQATGTVNPETWTHGSAAERSSWFKRGFSTGSLADCDTFKAHSL